MLICRSVALVFVLSLSCLASAFSTHFMIEEPAVEKKTEAVEETRTQRMEENNVTNRQKKYEDLTVEIVPIITNVLMKSEDLVNMTPLKLAMIISAQHLLTSVQNTPVSGNLPEDTYSTLEKIVTEFNKTAQIIKLTAEYINISGHYILSSLNQFLKTSCDDQAVQDSMQSVKSNFLNTISDHIKQSVKEITEKSKQREITGSEVLISTSYHIVTAFQKMTNYVSLLTSESSKSCKSPPPSIEVTASSDKQAETVDNNDESMILEIEATPYHGKSHKSIKKDQAVPHTEPKFTKSNFDTQTIENLNENQDLTVEVFSPEAIIHDKQPNSDLENKQENELKVQESPKVRNPLKQSSVQYESFKKNKQNDDTQVQQKVEQISNKQMITDKELAESVVDSLSNVPWVNIESKARELDKNKDNVLKKNPQDLSNMLQVFSPRYKRPLQYQQKQILCNDNVEPVCGIDKSNNKFIIFLNDCKREVHNKLFGTDYGATRMETCVRLLLRISSLSAQLTPANRPSPPAQLATANQLSPAKQQALAAQITANQPKNYIDLRPR